MKIQRYRGDTYSESFNLSQNGQLINLDDATSIELAIGFFTGVSIIAGVKDSDPMTGRVTFPFTSQNAAEVGAFPYDLQVNWVNGEKTTFVKNDIEFIDDINKT